MCVCTNVCVFVRMCVCVCVCNSYLIWLLPKQACQSSITYQQHSLKEMVRKNKGTGKKELGMKVIETRRGDEKTRIKEGITKTSNYFSVPINLAKNQRFYSRKVYSVILP